MDFNGTWKTYSEENLEEFFQAIAVPEMLIKMRKGVIPLTVVEQNGEDFTITLKSPLHTVVNMFSVGKEAEVTTLDGRKLKCTTREENGKLITQTEKFTSVREIQGEDMVETYTDGSVTLTRRSKRI